MCLHVSKGGEGVGKIFFLAMGFDESVLEEGGRGENAVKTDKAYERVERREWAWEMKRETRKWSCSRP